MENILLLVHLLTAFAIIGLILMQQGKGADMGASFGAGASQTLFGSAGSGNFFSRMTAVFVFIFFATSFTLAVVAKQKTQVDDDLALPALQQQLEVPVEEGDVPALDTTEADVPSDTAAKDVPAKPVDDSEVPEVPAEP